MAFLPEAAWPFVVLYRMMDVIEDALITWPCETRERYPDACDERCGLCSPCKAAEAAKVLRRAIGVLVKEEQGRPQVCSTCGGESTYFWDGEQWECRTCGSKHR